MALENLTQYSMTRHSRVIAHFVMSIACPIIQNR